MQDYVGGEIATEFGEPDAHFFEGGCVCYAVAENAGVRASVVESRDTSVLRITC